MSRNLVFLLEAGVFGSGESVAIVFPETYPYAFVLSKSVLESKINLTEFVPQESLILHVNTEPFIYPDIDTCIARGKELVC